MRRTLRWLGAGWDLVGADLPLFTTAAFLVIAGSLLSAFILALPLMIGLSVMFLDKLNGHRPSLRQLSEGLYRFPSAAGIWVVYLLANLPVAFLSSYVRGSEQAAPWVGALAEFGSHCLVATPLLFCVPLVADRDVGGLESVRMSWTVVRTMLLVALVSVVTYSLMIALGLFACGLGILITLPVVVAAQVVAYRECFPTGQDDRSETVIGAEEVES